MTTYPLATLAAQVTPSGISAPTYADVLESLKASYRSIFGSDVYLEADSQDGQLLAIFAAAINDCNAAAVAVYNAFSPATAKGVGLSSVVKINGIARQVATHSTADVKLVGVFGTVITGGQIGDAADLYKWNLPASVTIPAEGEIVVTATCATEGAIAAAAGALTKILTPTLGWQSVTNDAAATEGAPVETDAQLRIRQANSPALGAETPLKAVQAGVAALAGVTQLRIYENDTDATDGNGLPEHSVAVVVKGGDASAIGQEIFDRKGIGTATYGSTTVSALDPYGAARSVKFSRPSEQVIQVKVTIHPLTGYTSAIGDAMRQAVADYINRLTIGDDLIRTRLYVPGNLYGGAGSEAYEVTNIEVRKSGGSWGTSDITIAFNELAVSALDQITLVTS